MPEWLQWLSAMLKIKKRFFFFVSPKRWSRGECAVHVAVQWQWQ
jgi:hypothetical protein